MQEVTRTQRMICWGIFLLVLVGFGVWMWQSKSYVTVHDFVTFPTLTTPLDIMSIVDAATSAVVSVGESSDPTSAMKRTELILPGAPISYPSGVGCSIRGYTDRYRCD